MNDYHIALKRLGIEDFSKRIWNSNSHGELGHVYDYIDMAKFPGDLGWFRPAFLACVEFAERTWTRPESVFQHMPEMIQSFLDACAACAKE